MANDSNRFQAIISHCKEYGFIFPSSEIYDGLQAVYDYGQMGSELKKNIKDYWWKSMTQLRDNIVGIDAAIFMHPTTWKASGHVDNFNDPMIDNRDSKKRYRVDHLIEGYADELRTAGNENAAAQVIETMEALLGADDFAGLKKLIEEKQIKCAVSGTCNWTDIRQFNLMFATEFGSTVSTEDEDNKVYLRPETAQGIFVNFLNVQKTGRMKVPFGIAQIGKAFRNEIVARQFIFRMREFEQMEMQFFVRPGTQQQWYEYWKEERLKWVDPATGKPYGNYIPYVIETSIGLDRMFLAVLSHAYEEQDLSTPEKTDSRVVLKLPAALAPIKMAVLPLNKKDGLPEIAEEIIASCRNEFRCFYEEKDSIGKRYRRMDALGTPFCVTVDYQTKEDQTVTIRHRDSMEQERVPITALKELVLKAMA